MARVVYLVDGSSYFYRAFHALPPLTNSRGMPTHAVLGFTRMLLKILNEDRPDRVAVVFDAPGPTFRDEMYREYKANRPPAPEDLVVQLPYAARLLDGLRVPRLALAGYEADDIIGTIARRAEAAGLEVVIVSGDKDFCQVLSDRVSLLDTMKGKRTTPAEVKERFGVEPPRLIEVFGLMGDSVDNIPGVPGIGEKTAVELIRRFGTIENLLAHVDEVSGKKRQESLRKYAEQARLSRLLATIKTDVPLDVSPEGLRVGPPDAEALSALFGELELSKLAAELAGPRRVEAADDGARAELPSVASVAELEELAQLARSCEKIGIAVAASGNTPRAMMLAGLALSTGPGRARFASLGPRSPLTQAAPAILSRVLGSERPATIGHDLKRAIHALRRADIVLDVRGFDTQIASWLLNPSRKTYGIEEMGEEHLGWRREHAGKGGGPQGELPLGEAGEDRGRSACEEADLAVRLEARLAPRLVEAGLMPLFHDVEMPLVRILADMEWVGLRVDRAKLGGISAEFENWIAESLGKIHEMAGVIFNPSSPAQLREVLFDKLCLPSGKKKKTGLSTDVDVLASLAPLHPLPGEVLRYRGLTKLKGTYVDALMTLVDPATGRVHTSYHQTGTATGRLSSSNPNLQNIPIRTEEGQRIREAFLPADGCVFVSADYSQIELRLLAHLSGDEVLRGAFRRGDDVHATTAAALFGVATTAVTSEMRRKAKVVNFGIAYGMSAFGLSQELGIEPYEAQTIIARSFERYPAVKAYLEAKKDEARRQGWVSTVLGRRRSIPEITSSNATQRAAAERVAINTPIQGSAADLIKVAMVRVDRALREQGLGTECAMVLQVHDELLLEAPRERAGVVEGILRTAMESALELSVPLEVTTKTGSSWREIA